ncbi:MAG: acetylornithine deacetylase [Acidimicrobiia bacterium]
MTHPMRDAVMFLLGDLVGFPTVTSESNLELIDFVAGLLEPHATDMRMTHDATGQKANLLATIGPNIEGGVVLSGHSDVVPAEEVDWTGAPFVAMRRDQKIFGRGTSDMKGFLACAIAMASTYAEMPLESPIHIALTFDEEVGCRGAPLLISNMLSEGPIPAVAIVGEPTEMRIITAHKGCYEYTTTIVGVEGHGSQPEHGVNAVQHGARYIGRLLELAADLRSKPPANSPYDPPHTTISAGTIHGGTARNVIAGECVIEWEMRPVTGDDASYVLREMTRFEDELAEAIGPECTIVTEPEGEVDGLEAQDGSPALALLRDLLGVSETGVVPFGTEAGLYQKAGIPAAVCGPGSIEVAHQPDEYVSLDQLEACLVMMEALGERLAGTPIEG